MNNDKGESDRGRKIEVDGGDSGKIIQHNLMTDSIEDICHCHCACVRAWVSVCVCMHMLDKATFSYAFSVDLMVICADDIRLM